MAIITVSDAVYAWLSRVLNFICFLYAICSIIHHCIKVKEHATTASTRSNKRKTRVHYSLYLSIALIIFVLLYNVFSLFIQWANITDVTSCRVVCFGAFNGYVAVKWALYMILSFRGSEAFGQSHFGISKVKLIAWRVFVTIANVVSLILGVMAWDVVINKDGNYYTCRLDTEFDAKPLMLIGLVDIIACGVNLSLFIIPLNRISKEMNKNNAHGQSPKSQDSQKTPKSLSKLNFHVTQTSQSDISVAKFNDPLHKVAKKLTLLTVISVGTTLGATTLIVVFAMPAVWYVIYYLSYFVICVLLCFVSFCYFDLIEYYRVSIDCIFNIMTTLLTFKWNQKYYQLLCQCQCTCKCGKNEEMDAVSINN